MKNLIFLIFVFSVCSNSFLSTNAKEAVLDELQESFLSSNAKGVVRDGRGNELEVGSKYYIKSAKGGDDGGGLTVAATGAQRCGVTVVQEIVDIQNGVPVTFHPADPKEIVIHESSSVNIKFEAQIGCANSTVWRVGLTYIQIEGVEGNPGCETLANWFKIEKADQKGDLQYVYKLVFNPNGVCYINTPPSDLIRVFPLQPRPLALGSGNAFNVKFWKHTPEGHHDEL